MSDASDSLQRNVQSAGERTAITLQERATTWPEVVQAQQSLVHTLQEMVHHQHAVLGTLAHLEASSAAIDRGRALMEALIQTTQLAIEMEELELQDSKAATRAVLAALTAEDER